MQLDPARVPLRFKLSVAGLVTLLVTCGVLVALLHDPPPVEAARHFERTLRRDNPTVEHAQAIATDASLSIAERLGALRYLRRSKNSDGTDARTDAVVNAMLQIFEDSSDPELRTDVLRQLEGARSDILRQPLLEVLAHDPSIYVRSKAAEGLAPFIASDVVRTALREAVASDPSPRVKALAAGALDGL